jgi:transposase
MAIEGFGPITATALVEHAFKNGRQFAAWLGLTPRQNSAAARPGWAPSASTAM